MNSNSTMAPRRRRILPFLLLALGVMFIGICLGLASYVCLGRETRTLRQAMLPKDAERRTVFQANIGPATMALARYGLTWVEMDEELRTALRAIKGVQVGVYKVNRMNSRQAISEQWEAADQAMRRRGWERMLAVAQPNETVLIYVPQNQSSDTQLKLCLAVLQKDEMVVVSARGDMRPLIGLASTHIAEFTRHNSLRKDIPTFAKR